MGVKLSDGVNCELYKFTAFVHPLKENFLPSFPLNLIRMLFFLVSYKKILQSSMENLKILHFRVKGGRERAGLNSLLKTFVIFINTKRFRSKTKASRKRAGFGRDLPPFQIFSGNCFCSCV